MEVKDTNEIDMFFGERRGNFSGELTFFSSDHDWEGLGNAGSATHEALSFVTYVVAFLPLGESFELFGKAGINFWSVDVEAEIPALNLSGKYIGEDGVDFAYGGGASFNYFESFNLRLDYQVLPGMGDGIDEGDISKLSVNMIFPFN